MGTASLPPFRVAFEFLGAAVGPSVPDGLWLIPRSPVSPKPGAVAVTARSASEWVPLAEVGPFVPNGL